MARKFNAQKSFFYDTMRKMAELGLFGIYVSEAYGGRGWIPFLTLLPQRRSPESTVPMPPPLPSRIHWASGCSTISEAIGRNRNIFLHFAVARGFGVAEFQGSRHGHAALFQGHNCANHAIQLHGGCGLMKEYVAERFYHD